MTDSDPNSEGQPAIGCPSIFGAALFGLCPRCGAKTLYENDGRRTWIAFARRCRACGLDIAAFNVGDGPAAFLTLILGSLVTGLALWLELTVHPPFWVHVALWVPLTIAGVIGGLRAAKAALLAAEYQRQAGQATRND